jgi:hypothetical protein
MSSVLSWVTPNAPIAAINTTARSTTERCLSENAEIRYVT